MKATEDVVNVLCNLETEQGCEAHFKTSEVLKTIYIYAVSQLFQPSHVRAPEGTMSQGLFSCY